MSISNGSTAVVCFSAETCVDTLSDPTYDRYLLDIEKNFDTCGFVGWMESNWKICQVIIVLYLVAIYLGQRYMKNKQPIRSQRALLAWNSFLAILSIVHACRVVPATLYQLRHAGFHETSCGRSSWEYTQAIYFHIMVFHVSKVVELGDTAFIVARKSRLNFLHWFHHATVLFFVWSTSAYVSLIQAYFMTINYFVHSFMYTYFALKALNIRLPKAVNMSITIMQLVQMLFGVFVTLYAYRMKSKPEVGCCVRDEAITIATSIYGAYFALFLNFFYRSYFVGKKSAVKSTKKLD